MTTSLSSPTLRAEMLLGDLVRFCVLADPGRVFVGWSTDSIRAYMARRIAARRLVRHLDGQNRIDGFLAWHKFSAPFSVDDPRTWRPDDERGDNIVLFAAIIDNAAARRWCILRAISLDPDLLHARLWIARSRSATAQPQLKEFPRRAASRLFKY